jgi:hypothetical protein
VTGNAPISLDKKKKILNLIPLRVRGFGRWYVQEAVPAQARPPCSNDELTTCSASSFCCP